MKRRNRYEENYTFNPHITLSPKPLPDNWKRDWPVTYSET